MEKPEYIIRPPARAALGWRELWQYRELFYFFTWRDIKVKYKEAVLGILWAILQPAGLMLLFLPIFSRYAPQGNSDLPYPVFVLSGLVLWNLFYAAVSHASESIVAHAAIIKKIYFPRLIIPVSAFLVALFDFCFAFLLLIGVLLYYHTFFTAAALWYVPAALLLLLLTAFGLGTLLSSLTLKYRDFRYLLPFLLQVGFFASQVIYAVDGVATGTLKYVLALNPVNAAIDLFRASLSGARPDPVLLWPGVAVALLLSFAGLTYFRKTERYFADIA